MKEKQLINAVTVSKEDIMNARRNGFGGTAGPGRKAMELCPDILERLSAGVRSVIVSGTNGKTTTCRMLSAFFSRRGIDPVANRAGANMKDGIVTAFIEKTDENGKLMTDHALIECDEMYAEEVAGILRPECFVLTNLSEDQLYRFHFADVKERIVSALAKAPEAVVCINQDDENLMALAGRIGNPLLLYGIRDGQMILGTESFALPLEDLRQEYRVDAAAACAAARVLGLFGEDYPEILSHTQMPFARMESFPVGKSRITMELLKNPASYQGVAGYLKGDHTHTALIMATDDERELAWMKKEDFAQLKSLFSERYVIGTAADAEYLLAELEAFPMDQPGLMEYCKAQQQDIFLLTEYYAMMKIRNELCRDGYVPPMWEV